MSKRMSHAGRAARAAAARKRKTGVFSVKVGGEDDSRATEVKGRRLSRSKAEELALSLVPHYHKVNIYDGELLVAASLYGKLHWHL